MHGLIFGWMEGFGMAQLYSWWGRNITVVFET